jgi:SAM-dependent methyltransferase
MNNHEIYELVSRYYDSKLGNYGPTPKGVDWKDDDSQFRRLVNLLELVETDDNFSILDFGCGYGALLDQLNLKHSKFSYYGTDLSNKMMASLKLRFNSHENVFTLEPDEAKKNSYDYVLASGVFNVMFSSIPKWEEHIFSTLDELFEMCNIGYAANFLSSYSDKHYRKENLYYADPARILSYVLQKHSKKVKVVHEAELYDFSILVYRK